MMKKEEYIRLKWEEAGFVWDEIKFIVSPITGGLQLQHTSLKTSLTGYLSAYDKGLLQGYDFNGNGLKVWNKLLDGIEYNNGWNKINSRADLPKTEGTYLFYFTDHRMIEQYHSDDISIGGVTHWREIVKIPKPLY